MAALLRLSSRLEAGWAELQASFDQSLCLLSYAKSALLWHTHTHTQFCIFIKFCWMLNFPFCVYYFNIKFLTRVFRFCLISNQPVQFITDQSADRFVLQRAIKLTYNVKSHAHFFWVMNSVYKKKKIYQHCLLKKILLADIIRLLFFVLNIIVNIW